MQVQFCPKACKLHSFIEKYFWDRLQKKIKSINSHFYFMDYINDRAKKSQEMGVIEDNIVYIIYGGCDLV